MTPDSEICTDLNRRFGRLKTIRATWQTTWEDLRKHLLPAHGRGLTAEANTAEWNDGSRRDSAIYDGTPLRALKVAAAGLQSGLTSPSRPWFSLTVDDFELRDRRDVRVWLSDVEDRMRAVFNRSRLYNGLHHLYLELLAFATGAIGVFDSLDSLLRIRPYTIGEYWLACDADGRPDAFYSAYTMTAGQMVTAFGEEAVSESVRESAKTNPDRVCQVLHVIERNDSRIDVGLRRYAYRSIYLELGATDRILARRGYYEMPVLAVRWHVVGQDTYGFGPGHDVLGDAKQLQKVSEKKLVGLDKVIEPPMVAPGSMRTTAVNSVPGGITYTDEPDEALRPLYQVQFDLQQAQFAINDLRLSIQKGLFNDLFLMLIAVDAGKMTATEVAERKQEKLLMLGPVLERLNNELLDPLIDRAFAMMLRAGLIPEPPPEIQGAALRVEYVSPLAVAQKQLGLNGLNQLLVSVGQVAAVQPTVLDKIDFDEVVDTIADAQGVPPRVLRDERGVAAIRQQREAQQQALQAGQAALTAAKAAKDAAGATADGDTVLSRMLDGGQSA